MRGPTHSKNQSDPYLKNKSPEKNQSEPPDNQLKKFKTNLTNLKVFKMALDPRMFHGTLPLVLERDITAVANDVFNTLQKSVRIGVNTMSRQLFDKVKHCLEAWLACKNGGENAATKFQYASQLLVDLVSFKTQGLIDTDENMNQLSVVINEVLSHMSSQLLSHAGQLRDKDATITSLQSELEKKNAELEKKNAELEKKIADLGKRTSQLFGQGSTLKSQLEEKDATITKLESQLQEKDATITKLESQLDDFCQGMELIDD